MVSSFSKTYGMTGFRVGYGIGNNNIISKMRKVQATCITSVAEPMQYSALGAIGDDIQGNIDSIQSRINLICKRLQQMKTKFIVPNGAMYIFPKILIENYSDDISLVYDLLQNGVAIAPGSGFGNAYKKFIRISACQSPKLLNEGLDILEKYLK